MIDNNTHTHPVIKVTDTDAIHIRDGWMFGFNKVIQVSNIAALEAKDFPTPVFPTLSVDVLIVGLVALLAYIFLSPKVSDLIIPLSYADEIVTNIPLRPILTVLLVIAIIVIAVAVIWFLGWLFDYLEAKQKGYLYVITSSGKVYPFLFNNKGFLKKVLQRLTEILVLKKDIANNTNVSILVQACEFRDNTSVLDVTDGEGTVNYGN